MTRGEGGHLSTGRRLHFELPQREMEMMSAQCKHEHTK